MKSLGWDLIHYDSCPYEKRKFRHRHRYAKKEETETQGE